MKVGAINCIRRKNMATCRHFNVSGYPVVKLFPPLSTKDDTGKNLPHEQQDKMIQILLDRATDIQKKTHPPSWPNLAPYE